MEAYNEFYNVDGRNVIKSGDFVVIAYNISFDGKIIHEVNEEPIKIGANFFIEKIEKKLIRKKINDIFDIAVTISEADKNISIAGKEVVYNISVKSIQEIKK